MDLKAQFHTELQEQRRCQGGQAISRKSAIFEPWRAKERKRQRGLAEAWPLSAEDTKAVFASLGSEAVSEYGCKFFCTVLRRIMLLAAAYPAYCDALQLALQSLAATCATDHYIAVEVAVHHGEVLLEVLQGFCNNAVIAAAAAEAVASLLWVQPARAAMVKLRTMLHELRNLLARFREDMAVMRACSLCFAHFATVDLATASLVIKLEVVKDVCEAMSESWTAKQDIVASARALRLIASVLVCPEGQQEIERCDALQIVIFALGLHTSSVDVASWGIAALHAALNRQMDLRQQAGSINVDYYVQGHPNAPHLQVLAETVKKQLASMDSGYSIP